MLNSKETLKNLHKKLPQLNLDELFDILDCYVEECSWFNNQYWTTNLGVLRDSDLRIKNIDAN